MKVKVTVTFEYEADLSDYPEKTPESVVATDTELLEDLGNLALIMGDADYTVTLEPEET